jgi:hypothetical protein
MLVKRSKYTKNLYSFYIELEYLKNIISKNNENIFNKECIKLNRIYNLYFINQDPNLTIGCQDFYEKPRFKKYILKYRYFLFKRKSYLEQINYIYKKIEKLINLNCKLKSATIKMSEYNYDYNGGITNNLNSIKKELEDKTALLMIHELKTIPIYGKN